MDLAAPLESKLSLHRHFSAEYLETHQVLPVEVADELLTVAVGGDPDADVIADLEDTFDYPVRIKRVAAEDIVDAVRRAYSGAESVLDLVSDLSDGLEVTDGFETAEHDIRNLANQPPVIRFVNLLIREAHEAGASDIHLEATRDGVDVRFRVDGLLSAAPAPPANLRAAVVSRVKLIGDLDIAERRQPQDGRVRVRLEDRELDLRISTLPSLHGESVVLRLLDQGDGPTELGSVGMARETLDRFSALARLPHGIVLATGPTGSGKTTTLYGALQIRDRSIEKVITVEDPVEYQLDGITQVPVNRKAGMTFAAGLRSILRQDPDVVMVGEMRDRETAEIAVQASMTGHLVFSTLHTNDAASAVSRLLDLGLQPYMLAATLEGVLAQRLVRMICDACREPYEPDPATIRTIADVSVDGLRFERGAGCEACRGTGYRGRTGIFELLTFDESLRAALLQPGGIPDFRRIAREQGLRTLRDDGWRKVRQSVTTVEEVARVAQA